MICSQCNGGKEFKPDELHFCSSCSSMVHKHPSRASHTPVQMEEVPELELLSVLCIETSHYVCFSRDSEGRWLFFDSMADRLCELPLTNEPLITSLSHQMTSTTYPEGWSALPSSTSGYTRETRRG